MPSFALYRLANERACVCVTQTDTHACGVQQASFVIHPFVVSAESGPVRIYADRTSLYGDVSDIDRETAADIDRMCAFNQKHGQKTDDSRREYFDEFDRLHMLLSEHRVDKIVLSRQEFVEALGQQSPFDLFVRACRLYGDAYIALISTPQTGVWLVASPELLLKATDGRCHTMALAGTMSRDEYQRTGRWSEKNRLEQQMVSRYVMSILDGYAQDVVADGPKTVEAGDLKHLRTDFSFVVDSGTDLLPVVKALHPTPAVCGMPKDIACRLITETESRPRTYYAGFSGPVDIYGVTSLYMTLRCMRIDSNGYTLYAGGGLLPESTAESEWGETCAKMRTMLRVIEGE